jgi:hypothetical protein
MFSREKLNLAVHKHCTSCLKGVIVSLIIDILLMHRDESAFDCLEFVLVVMKNLIPFF